MKKDMSVAADNPFRRCRALLTAAVHTNTLLIFGRLHSLLYIVYSAGTGALQKVPDRLFTLNDKTSTNFRVSFH